MNNKYVSNSVLNERYSIDNVVNSEIESRKKQVKVDDKYNRNIFIQKYNASNTTVQVGFLHDDGKLKSNIYYNKKGQPIREIFRSNYGIGDYTAVSDFIYDNLGTLKRVITKIDDGTEFIKEY